MVSGLRTPGRGALALRFFAAAVLVFAAAAGVAWLLIRTGGGPSERGLDFPSAFWVTTALLALGSAALQRSLGWVRLERQAKFRRTLLAALGAGTLFVGVQSYGLWCLLQQQQPARAETGPGAFVFVFSALHGMHFTVALLFLVFVTVQGLADRYDHEYHWGVTVCTYFWHFLGAVWVAILGVFLIAV